ncbi:MAG: hypothetical protein V8S34_06355 [Lawsonibacter sp.]
MRSRAPLALMEQTVMVLVFALAAALCLRAFALADGISRQVEATDRAVLWAESAADTCERPGTATWPGPRRSWAASWTASAGPSSWTRTGRRRRGSPPIPSPLGPSRPASRLLGKAQIDVAQKNGEQPVLPGGLLAGGGEHERGKARPPVVGGSSLLVIFAVLCLTVFALLSLPTVQADRRLAQSSWPSAVTGYYQADCQAEEILSRLRAGERPEGVTEEGEGVFSYACPISDTQTLEVRVRLAGETGPSCAGRRYLRRTGRRTTTWTCGTGAHDFIKRSKERREPWRS